MKRVVIGVDNGKPYVIHCPRGIEVVIKPRKRRTIRKIWRTWWYKLRTLAG